MGIMGDTNAAAHQAPVYQLLKTAQTSFHVSIIPSVQVEWHVSEALPGRFRVKVAQKQSLDTRSGTARQKTVSLNSHCPTDLKAVINGDLHVEALVAPKRVRCTWRAWAGLELEVLTFERSADRRVAARGVRGCASVYLMRVPVASSRIDTACASSRGWSLGFRAWRRAVHSTRMTRSSAAQRVNRRLTRANKKEIRARDMRSR